MSAEGLAAGTRLGPYEVMECVGRGGMGAVYKGYDRTLNRHVALKVLPGDFLSDGSFAERFRREAQIWGRLDHASIVPVYFADIEKEIPFLAMKFVGGGSLAELVRKGPLPLDQAAAILAEIAGALDYAHALGIVHRDVKPGNVLLGDGHRAYLSDFGIARVVAMSVSDTQTGVVGTPGYMAPEQARSLQPDPRSDLYSLGCMAYEMLTGTQPFRGETAVDVMMKHITEHPTPPRALSPTLPLHAEAAILKAMAKDPAERWPRAILFVQALLGQVLPEGIQTVSIQGHAAMLAAATPPARAAVATPVPAAIGRSNRFARRVAMAGLLLAAVPFAWRWGGPARTTALDATSEPASATTALAGARRALDEGAYPEALDLAELALRLDPGRSEAQILRERVRRAWEAERSLGLWRAPQATPGPPQPTTAASPES